jgi:hypothetical protein
MAGQHGAVYECVDTYVALYLSLWMPTGGISEIERIQLPQALVTRAAVILVSAHAALNQHEVSLKPDSLFGVT